MNYSGGDNGEAGYGSASGKQSGKDFVLEVCREATRSRCKRSESQCRYAHPTPNVHIIDGKVQCCADFLKGRCFRVSPPCRYFHPPPHLVMELMPSGDLGANRILPSHIMDNLSSALASAKAAVDMFGSSVSGGKQCERMEVCRDFLRGRCQRDDCRFAHPSDHVAVDANNLVVVCIDFLNGRCSRPSCRYFHPPSHLAKSKANPPGTVCRDFLFAKCNRANCRYLHSTEAKVADDKQRSDQVMDVCRDFLNGRCHRPVCRYYHPSSTTDERFTQAAAGVSEQSADVCKDFLNGRCNRAVCRFYHPPTVGAVVELESHSTSVVLGKRPYTEYDYSDVVGADVGQLQYASVPVESYDVAAKRPLTDY